MNNASRLRSLLTRTDGVSATEFALCLPVMVILWLGSAQLFQLETASLKTDQAAASVSNLMTRGATLGDPTVFSGPVYDLKDLYGTATTILSPLDASTLSVDIANIAFDNNNNGTMVGGWHCYLPANAPATNHVNLVNGLGVQGQTVIMVTATYTYTPTITGGSLTTTTFASRSIEAPRLSVTAMPEPNFVKPTAKGTAGTCVAGQW